MGFFVFSQIVLEKKKYFLLKQNHIIIIINCVFLKKNEEERPHLDDLYMKPQSLKKEKRKITPQKKTLKKL